MSTENQIAKGGRFAFLKQFSECPRPIYDEILFETDNCVVTPTLGSIVPNWLLVVPRSPMLNFAQWNGATHQSPLQLVRKVLDKCNPMGGRAVWFEHGPAQKGSILGCGVDQAHLHIIYDAPFSVQELWSKAAELGKLDWSFGPADSVYASIGAERSYLVAGSLDSAGFVHDVERVGSQFFRRVIAEMVSRPDAWNYRSYAHLSNVRETLRTFSAKAK